MTLDPNDAQALEATHAPPGDDPLWSENFAWVCHDPASGAGILAHLGRMPVERSLWRATVVAYLPDRRLVVSKTVVPGREGELGTGNLTLTCRAPLERWSLRYVGFGTPTSSDALARGRVLDGELVPLRIELEFERLAPVWNLGEMMSLGATHYEQFGRYTGTVTAAGVELPVDCAGYRDHSTGHRDLAGMGGHVWTHAWFPSGRAFCAFRATRPDGEVALNDGFVLTDGRFGPAAPLEVPELHRADGAPYTATIVLPGCAPITAQTLHAVPLSLGEPNDFFLGADPALGGKVMVDCPARFEWDGEIAHGWLERSGVLSGAATLR